MCRGADGIGLQAKAFQAGCVPLVAAIKNRFTGKVGLATRPNLAGGMDAIPSSGSDNQLWRRHRHHRSR